MIKNWTIGSDAEMFVKLIHDNSVFPVCGLVGGTKAKPKAMGGGGYFVQEDNILLEFNIPVCNSSAAFVRAMLEGVARARRQLPPSMSAEAQASGHVDKAFLRIEQACVFGCEPDFNAWQRTVNPRPRAEDETLRTAAAHIHIGWDEPNDHDRHELIKAADLFASIPSLYEDKDKERRKLYGKAGAFRIKEYGVEHRVLSNYWITDPFMVEMIYSRYKQAVDFVNRGVPITEEDGIAIQQAINNYDLEAARPLVRKFKLQVL